MAIDDQLVLKQRAEQPIDILKVPYQSLKMPTLHAATIARSRAEWSRNTTGTMLNECTEFDREASLVDHKMEELGKGIIRTVQMGGQMHKCEISKFNQDVIKSCNYCTEEDCTIDHLRWKCKPFDAKRKAIDK